MSNKIFFSALNILLFCHGASAMEVETTSPALETETRRLQQLVEKLEELEEQGVSSADEKENDSSELSDPKLRKSRKSLRLKLYQQCVAGLLSRIDSTKASALIMSHMNSVLHSLVTKSSNESLSLSASQNKSDDLTSADLAELAKRYANLVCLPPHQTDGLQELSASITQQIGSKLKESENFEEFLTTSHELLSLKADSNEWINFCFEQIYHASSLTSEYSQFELACLLSSKGILRAWIDNWLKQNRENGNFQALLTRSFGSFTPLNAVAQAGSKSTAKLLVNAGADITRKSESGDTPIMIASLNGHKSFVEWTVKRLLKKLDGNCEQLSRELNTPNNQGCTALYYAVENGHEAVADVLLKNGATTQLAVESLSPLLYIAIHRGNFRLVKLLVDYKANINEKYDESCPLNSAIINCGLAQDKESFIPYTAQQIRERVAIFEFLIHHPNFDRSIDFQPLIKTAYYYGLNEIANQLEQINIIEI